MNSRTAIYITIAFALGALTGSVALVSAQDAPAAATLKNSGPSGVIDLAPPAPKQKKTGRRYVKPSGAIHVAEYPKRGIIIGRVIELSTYAMYAEREDTPAYAAAARLRARQGFPVGILEEGTGDVYIALHKKTAPASRLGPANTKLAPYMGKRVVAAGLRYRTEGVNIFRISVMSEF